MLAGTAPPELSAGTVITTAQQKLRELLLEVHAPTDASLVTGQRSTRSLGRSPMHSKRAQLHGQGQFIHI